MLICAMYPSSKCKEKYKAVSIVAFSYEIDSTPPPHVATMKEQIPWQFPNIV